MFRKITKTKISVTLSIAILAILSGCKSDEKFNFLDAATGSGVCQFSSVSPAADTTVRAGASSSATTTFSVTPGGSDCTISYYLNGTEIPNQSTSVLSLASSSLNAGNNELEARITGTTASDSKKWTVRKNVAPTCSTQSPAATGQSLGVGANVALTANGSDTDGDTLTWSWSVNNTTAASGVLSIISNSNQSLGIFAPNSSLVGASTVKATMTDGYDTASCDWAVTVASTCVITGAIPSSATVRVPATPTASTNFVVSTGGGGCSIAWALNGVTLPDTTTSISVLSSALNPSNVLTATATNGASTTTQSWTITKNTAPTCSQSPSASGNTLGVGASLALTSTSTDANSDPLSFSWTVDGATVSNTILSVSSGSNNSTGTFSPDSNYIGTHNIKASISDTYDVTTCSWTATVTPTCAVSASLPSTATTRVANAGATSTTFAVVPNDASCAITWSLNGSPLSGQTSSFLTVLSSSLSAGANTLVASLNNGATTTTRTWTVTKNSVPTCGSQTPSASGNTMSRLATLSLTANGSDSNADSLTFAWKLDNALQPTLFSATSTSSSSTAVFSPGLAQVGNGRIITAEMNDGYDTGTCQWSLDVQDPDTVSISSCSPSASPVVVASTGAASTQQLNVAATGTSLSYVWKQNGSTIGGATSPALTLTAGGLAVGSYTYKVEVSDAYANMQSCTWTVKRNSPPVLSSAAPSNSATTRLNYASSQSFSVSGTDANSDTITYTWTLDGAANATLPSGFANTTFAPNSSLSLLGSHTVTVTASDGVETSSLSWPAEVNLFTDACNTVYNGTSGTSGTTAGRICTLVGIPGVGDGKVPSADQSLIRIQPYDIESDPSGNVYYISDILSHVVWVWNQSASTITRFGISIPAGQIKAVIGNGSNGSSTDGLANLDYKLNYPYGIAVDPGTNQGGSDPYSQATLYISDYNNHRVVQLATNGIANRIFGTAGTGTTVNTDGLVGTSHHCQNPVGLQVTTIGSDKALVVNCSGGNVIKYMGLNSGNASTYLKGYVLVGRLTAGASNAGNTDGASGASGDALVNLPWSLRKDSSGNLYWTDSNTGRLRMLNLSGSTKSFFSAGNGRTTSTTNNLSALEAASGWTANFNTVASAPGGAANNFSVWGPTLLRTTICYPYYVQRRDSSNVSMTTGSAQTVNLAITSGTAALYSDSGCTTGTTTTTIAANQATGVFYIKQAGAGSSTFSASFAGFTTYNSGTLTVAALSGSAPNAINFVGPSEFLYTDCVALRIQFKNGAAIAATTSATSVYLTTGGTGNFYDGNACAGNPINKVTIPISTTEYNVSYQRTANAINGSVITLAGNGSSGSTAYNGANTTNSIMNVGNLQMRAPRGLAVVENAGTLLGFLVSQYDNARILFINASASTKTYGNVAIEPGDVNTIVGTGTSGYSSEDIGSIAQINLPHGIYAVNANTIYFSDTNNGRLRSMDLSVNAGQTGLLFGQGLLRSGFNGDGASAATASMNSPAYLEMDSTNRYLMIADNANRRIRQVVLNTGVINTLIGKGYGNPTTEDEQPTNVFTQGPTGIRLHTSGANQYVIYSDINGGTGSNLSCMLRAYNRSASSSSLFGISFNASRLNTIMGDYNTGCNVWGSTVNGTTGLSVPLYSPYGFAIDSSGTLFLSNYSDHCMLKMTSAGAVSSYMGTCGNPAGYPGGSTASTAILRYPTGIHMDSTYSADGNFFFMDGLDQNPGRIRYVNYRTSGFTYAGVSIPAGSASNPSVTTMFFMNNSGQGRLYGMAQFGNQFCYGGGDFGNSANGPHNVTCRDLSTALGTITLRVGPDEATSTVRGGGPLGTEQENIASTSARMYGPSGLVFDPDGNLYISDRSNHIVRMVRRWY